MEFSMTVFATIAGGVLERSLCVDSCRLLSLPSLVLTPSLNATMLIQHFVTKCNTL